IDKCEIFVFASKSTSSQSNTTHFPSGDGTGAPTRLSFIMSSKVNGCLPLETLRAGVCATTEVVSARLIARKTFMNRKGSAEVADMQSATRSFAVVELRSKRFPRHFQAQSFDLLKLILRPLFELAEIRSLQRRKIRR